MLSNNKQISKKIIPNKAGALRDVNMSNMQEQRNSLLCFSAWHASCGRLSGRALPGTQKEKCGERNRQMFFFFFLKVKWMTTVIPRGGKWILLMEHIKLPSKSRWWKLTGCYWNPITGSLPCSPSAPSRPSSPFLPPSIRGTGISDCGRLIQTSLKWHLTDVGDWQQAPVAGR